MLTPTIGIEVHVELKSKTKVFSDSINNFKDDINTNVNVIDLGFPGTLPKLNKEVINQALLAALALNCKINKVMHFDRKNYFYPDLPKGYQITQKDTPIGYDGYVEIEDNGVTKKIELERIHIEEDTCKSIHKGDKTLLNANRAGVPLIEIVTKPVIKSANEAMLYLEKLRETLLYLGVSDVKIEEGSMRCEANISLSETDVLGKKVEIKNIGSISNVGLAIDYEIKRQTNLLNSGEKIVEQTRRFDDKTNTTILMRVKETGNDYRYMPEPDIPYVVLSDEEIEKVRNSIPKLPSELKKEYTLLGLNNNAINTLIGNKEINDYYNSIIDRTNPVILANLLTTDILGYLNKNFVKLNEIKLEKEELIKLIQKLDEKILSSKQSKEILNYILDNGGNIEEVSEKLNIKLINDDNELIDIVKKVLSNNEESINDYKNGKDRALKYLMGQIMKETKGQANPVKVNEILIKELSNY